MVRYLSSLRALTTTKSEESDSLSRAEGQPPCYDRLFYVRFEII